MLTLAEHHDMYAGGCMLEAVQPKGFAMCTENYPVCRRNIPNHRTICLLGVPQLFCANVVVLVHRPGGSS